MLGHLKPRFCHLTSPAKQYYQHLYCSICYSLRQQFGLSASFFINHELTLSLAAFPDYAVMETAQCACPAKLFCSQKTILKDSAIDKAAQFSLLLVWLKLVDSETDKPAFYKKQLREALEVKVQPILAAFNPTTRQFIDSYLLLIRANGTDFNTSAKMSGLLAQHIFQELTPATINLRETIAKITLQIGELITIADALLDLKQDMQQKQFNPIIDATLQNHTTLEQEYSRLKADYDVLVQRIRTLIQAENLSTDNPLFCEILQKSLHNLESKIQFANHAMFAASASKRRNKPRSDSWCECVDGCCECADCCQCCGENSSCCSSGESAGSCCDSGCCDCGGCDCSC